MDAVCQHFFVGSGLGCQDQPALRRDSNDQPGCGNRPCPGPSTTTRSGSIGWLSPKPATGCANVSTVTLSVLICWADSTTGAVSRCRSDSGRTWRTTATKVGMQAPVWSMVTSGCWVNVGASRLPSASAIYALIMTSTSALNAVNGKIAAKRTTWVSPRLPFL